MNDIECKCGKVHSSNFKLYESVSEAAAKGSHILYIGEESMLSLLKRHFRVSYFSSGSILCYTGESVNVFPSPSLEDIKVIFSTSKYISLSKKIAYENKLRLVLLDSGNLSEYSFLQKDGYISLINLATEIVKKQDFESTDDNLAKNFSQAALTLLSLFEWDISSLLFNQEICPFIFSDAKKAVINMLKQARQLGKHSINLKKTIYDTQIELAKLTSYLKSPVLLINGAVQAASAQHLLFTHEQRKLKSFEENCFLFSLLIVKTYLAFLSNPVSFSPPPDNNLRMSKICEYFGIREQRAYTLMSSYFDKIELTDYRLSVYREDLKRHLYEIKGLLESAYVMFFRLYDDDGFSYKGYLDSLDISLCIGLGSDIFNAKTLLTYMRHKGLLDKYIL